MYQMRNYFMLGELKFTYFMMKKTMIKRMQGQGQLMYVLLNPGALD